MPLTSQRDKCEKPNEIYYFSYQNFEYVTSFTASIWVFF